MSQPSVKTTANTTGIYHVKYHKSFLLCLTPRSSVQHLRAAVSSEMIPLPSTKDAAPMATCRSAGSPPLCVFILTVTVVFSPTLAEWRSVTWMAVGEFRRLFCVLALVWLLGFSVGCVFGQNGGHSFVYTREYLLNLPDVTNAGSSEHWFSFWNVTQLSQHT